ncbi:alkyl hydroperoxide reductase subunit c/ thiol specific antioxidant [Lucifera butyrica]|uniref:Peroxiredoxin n=1 Tax=Lucifera butyrica TaxID=1351585 RepID=A0A498R8H7_9FIRM|nr:peroxiredoxin [Lucifera butyrica]VBB07814.1 alkyl hydroperoxide reductase subunit c/ thiol specific antioxidant [Lucifera butyrica]
MEESADFHMPLLGDRFPEMRVKTTHGYLNLPGDYTGKWFVLFSHPGDFTPVCTTEFVSFQKRYQEFCRLNTELIGLSVDQVYAHLKWIEWIHDRLGVSIAFPVIADELGITANRLGMIHPKKGTNTVRAVFVIDHKGIIRAILYYPQEVGRNMGEILRLIDALQTTDRYSVATPANWPANELIGSDVIIPPPTTEEAARERLEKAEQGEMECFDWWLCHKSIKKCETVTACEKRHPAAGPPCR